MYFKSVNNANMWILKNVFDKIQEGLSLKGSRLTITEYDSNTNISKL